MKKFFVVVLIIATVSVEAQVAVSDTAGLNLVKIFTETLIIRMKNNRNYWDFISKTIVSGSVFRKEFNTPSELFIVNIFRKNMEVNSIEMYHIEDNLREVIYFNGSLDGSLKAWEYSEFERRDSTFRKISEDDYLHLYFDYEKQRKQEEERYVWVRDLDKVPKFFIKTAEFYWLFQ